jgi:hypothetical protein
MIYYGNPCSDKVREAMSDHLIGCITTPRQGNIIDSDWDIMADNGCFSDKWEREEWSSWLDTLPKTTRFVVAPDAYDPLGGESHKATLKLWKEYAPIIREKGLTPAFVCQPGSVPSTIPRDAEVLFIGGVVGIKWKLGPEARACAKWGKDNGKWVHMGRVNTRKRLRVALEFGCDSVDGTSLIYGPDICLAQMLKWIDQSKKYLPVTLEENKKMNLINEKKIKDFPCKFSSVIVDKLAELVDTHGSDGDYILDPMAGVGGVHKLRDMCKTKPNTVGNELEHEWADCHPRTKQGNCLTLPYPDEFFDWIIVSPPYGNRMADTFTPSEDDDSIRMTYKNRLGRDLSEDNSGGMQWGHDYRMFHDKTWAEAYRVLKPGGFFVLNVKDHIRKGVLQKVTEWHLNSLTKTGLVHHSTHEVTTPGNRFGRNGTVRVDFETVAMFTK